nr:galactose mutarotase [Lachnospiraceae bacterium]
MSTTSLGKTKSGKEMIAVTITNKNGMVAKTMNFGANLLELLVPDHTGNTTDVVLGFQNINDYEDNECYYGCTVARNANRIGGAAFDLNGVHYTLEKNDGNNNLHSGSETLAKKVWDIKCTSVNAVTYAYSSPDMEMGFPGAMELEVTYELTDTNALVIRYKGISNQDTIFNPTNHTYFNLNGQDGSTILDHVLTLDSDRFTWANSESIPDGTIKDVFSTPMDFTKPTPIGDRVDKDYDQLNFAGGYDHNYCLNQKHKSEEFSSVNHPVYFAAKLENKD